MCFHLCQDPQSCLFLQVFQRNTHVFFLVDAYNMETLYFIGWCADLEICALLELYTAYMGNMLPKFRLTLGYGTYRLPRNVCNKLPINAA